MSFQLSGSDWSFEKIEAIDGEIERLAHERYQLDTYANQIEIITSEQMLDAYASVGMPMGYHHWSYGKRFASNETRYRKGQMGLAYEIVINSNPCIAYLMEENSMAMQTLVIAHACYGHNSFFKGNYLFKTWTDADSIIDYLKFSRDYVRGAESRQGVEAVEAMLDSCHALMNYGTDRYKRPPKLSAHEEKARQDEREQHRQRMVNELWRTLPTHMREKIADDIPKFPAEPQENLLYFIEKHAPLLEPWQREVVRIVRKMAQYFYPQRQTQVMNEGWASFWHYTLLYELYEQGTIPEAYMMEVLDSHCAVVAQPAFDSPYYSGINPYALGFAMMRDIKRICEAPTDEDKEWFPDFAGAPWLETLHFAMQNFKDESFIQQFLSPQVIRDFRLFHLDDQEIQTHIHVADIHNRDGYRSVREALSRQYNLSNNEPNIQVEDVALRGDRSLSLVHREKSGRPLNGATHEVLKHMHRLWQFDVKLSSVDDNGMISREWHCPEREERQRA